MIKYFVLGLFFFITTIFICVFNIILLKKQIFYTYVNPEKKITNFDYLMDFDGNWLLKKINLNDIPQENRNDKFLLEKIKKIYLFKKALIFLLFLTVIFLIIVKIMKIV
ncbi:hypothetical protein FLACOL_00127 [Flavobacterium columnare]|uniref:Uncharacterized protein n=1 Tax=Flavobacterium columnare TaxID=996 RepID=A0A2N9P740_9FLAO|nr:hypothetical protein FLACOL_00127 [Flavobacterium columnare]